MNTADVLQLVSDHADERALAHHRRRHPDATLRPLGVGLTTLRKLAKQVGRDRALAAELWDSDVYELRVLALLIDEPRRSPRPRPRPRSSSCTRASWPTSSPPATPPSPSRPWR